MKQQIPARVLALEHAATMVGGVQNSRAGSAWRSANSTTGCETSARRVFRRHDIMIENAESIRYVMRKFLGLPAEPH